MTVTDVRGIDSRFGDDSSGCDRSAKLRRGLVALLNNALMLWRNLPTHVVKAIVSSDDRQKPVSGPLSIKVVAGYEERWATIANETSR